MGDAWLQKRPENKDWETAAERTFQKPEKAAQEAGGGVVGGSGPGFPLGLGGGETPAQVGDVSEHGGTMKWGGQWPRNRGVGGGKSEETGARECGAARWAVGEVLPWPAEHLPRANTTEDLN